MSDFESIIDQQRPVRILKSFLSKKTIPHALLFSGIEGVGKRQAALAFSMAANCATRPQDGAPAIDPCGACRSCRKIASGSHPDIFHLKPSGQYIRIAQVRELTDSLALKPFEADLRVVTISESQKMNPSAGNALLKILEEPPQATIFILTAPEALDLMPTIVSRCQQIRFNPVSAHLIVSCLVDELGLEKKHAATIAAMACGSLAKARAMASTGWFQHRDWVLAAAGLDRPDRLNLQPPSRLLAFAEALAAKKDQVNDTLMVVTCWLRDLVIVRYCPEKVMNVDLVDRLRSVSQVASVPGLVKQIDIIRTTRRKIESNCNLRLSLEWMVLAMANRIDLC